MSDFLGRVGRITEWVVISNLENRVVNAACDKAQDWWKNRKHKHHGDHNESQYVTTTTTMPVSDPKIPISYQFHTQPSQPMFQTTQPYPSHSTPLTAPGHLTITTNQIDGLNQWGPLTVIIECNHQRYQTKFDQIRQPFVFSLYQFEYDVLSIWIQAEFQQQIIAHAEIPVRILLSGSNSWTSLHQRWIPLRDHHNSPAGQILINADYQIVYSGESSNHRSEPLSTPPYSFYG